MGILWKTYRKITPKYWVNILKDISKITMEKIVTLPGVLLKGLSNCPIVRREGRRGGFYLLFLT